MVRRLFLKIFAVFLFSPTVKARTSSEDPLADSESMESLWVIYRQWLDKHFSEGKRALNDGATPEEVSLLETRVGMTLSQDYIDWLKIHNGQIYGRVGLLYSDEFLSTARVLDEWSAMKQLSDAGAFEHSSESVPPGVIKQDWWNKSWLPISSDGSGNLVCIDMSPGEGGERGQVIDFDHETTRRTLLASSFREYISNYLDDLENERYTYSEDFGKLLPLKEL